MADVYAQDGASSAEPPRGAWALQFQIGQNFTLQSFQGSTVSAKKDLSETRAFRFGATLDASFFDGDGDEERDFNRQQLAVEAQLLRYTPGEAEHVGTIRFYAGAGPQAQFSRSFNANSFEDYEGNSLEDKRTSVQWGVGASAALGAEWTVHRRIGLLAEYGSIFAYTHTRQIISRPQAEEVESSQNGISLRSDGVRFGVAVYL